MNAFSMMDFTHSPGPVHQGRKCPRSAAQFAQAIYEYLSKHQVEHIESFQISLNDTGTTLARLSVVGEFNKVKSTYAPSAEPDTPSADAHGPAISRDLVHSTDRVTAATRNVPVGHVFAPISMATSNNAAQDDDFDMYVSPYHEPSDEAMLAALLADMPDQPLEFGDPRAHEEFGSSDIPIVADSLGTAPIDTALLLDTISWTKGAAESLEPAVDQPSGHTSESIHLCDQTTNSHSRKRKRSSVSPAGEISSRAQALAQSAIHDNVYEYLEAELPRWIAHGLWKRGSVDDAARSLFEQGRETSAVNACYVGLERAYSTVVHLDHRMEDDVIRNRVALIQLHVEYSRIYAQCRNTRSFARGSSVGRGAASAVIDEILSRIHKDWHTLNRQRQGALRARFHDRKKCGKRWHSLTTGLGAGILLLSSPKLAIAVRCTTDSAKTLNNVVEYIRELQPAVQRIISTLTPLAECLIKNEGFENFDRSKILRAVNIAVQQCPDAESETW